MKKKLLSVGELKKLSQLLDDLEKDVISSNGLDHISGAFSSAEMFNYDDDIIDVELKFGVQDDVTNNVYVEQHQVDRKTMTVMN